MKKTKVGLVINRFSFLTNEHKLLMSQAAESNDVLIIAIGSSENASSMTCPFTYEMRKEQVEHIMQSDELHTYSYRIVPIEDHPYDGIRWVTNAHSILFDTLNELSLSSYEVNVYTFNNPSSYDKMFPRPTFNVRHVKSVLSDESILENFFIGDRSIFPDEVKRYYSDYSESEHYNDMFTEYMAIRHMKKSWESAPYPPTFVTTDAVVYTKGHVLVVNRNSDVGKNLYCLPGGFLPQSRTISSGIVSNLKKDTGIKVSANILASNVAFTHTFDDPMRSPRGRIITTAGLIVLDRVTSIDGLPSVRNVKGNKTHAQWMSLYDIERCKTAFFEDHYHIIKFMLAHVDNTALIT